MSRPLTPEVRRIVGLPTLDRRPYNWSFACFVVALAVAPLLVGRYWVWAGLVVLVGLGVVPLVRHLERREAVRREDLYLNGAEVVARVADCEPGARRKTDRKRPSGLVRVEFLVDGARVQASVFGSPLSRRGLSPGDDVVLVYDPKEPKRCLIVEKIAREAPKSRAERKRVREGGDPPPAAPSA